MREEIELEIEALRALLPRSAVDVIEASEEEDGESNNAPIVLHLVVPVRLPSSAEGESPGSVTVCASITNDDDVDDAAPSTSSSPPLLERSVSGGRYVSSFTVTNLPPLSLSLVLPLDYPTSPPIVNVSSSWLSVAQIDVVVGRLNEISVENNASPVLTEWIDWIEGSLCRLLAIDDGSTLTIGHDGGNRYRLIGQLEAILRHDLEMEQRSFDESDQECNICIDMVVGTEMCRISPCLHHCCVDCLSSYLNARQRDTVVDKPYFICPCDTNCKSRIDINHLRRAMTADQFDKWSDLSLSNALDGMDDIQYCPRCKVAGIHDKSSVAVCPHCLYSYCCECREDMHPGTPCQSGVDMLTAKIASLESTNKVDRSRRVRALLDEKRAELAELHMLRQYRKCPSCGARIEKMSGCNLVHCRCGQMMCYGCGEGIKGYNHFGECTEIFVAILAGFDVMRAPPDALLVQQAALEADPTLANRRRPCPRCRNMNLKTTPDNHLTCWACHTHYCYECQAVLRPPYLTHYNKGNANECAQHS